MARLFSMGLILLAGVQSTFGQAPVPPATSPTSVRIAIISTAEAADLAGLLTAEFSNNPAIALVERDDLARIGDELKVQQLASSDAPALGKLVNADGILFMEKQGQAIHARLTAVGLGYSVFDLQFDPGIDMNELAKSLSHRTEQFAPKLKLTSTQAIPLSVLNLRSDLPTTNAIQVERDLTLLLESRLASIPEYVLLERRHAWDLGFEHSLIAATNPQLLEGAYVVDGTLQITGANGSEVTAELRLRAPKSTQETPIEVKGRTDDLPGMVEAVATQITKAIGTTASTAAWQPQTEAREYLREGIWAWEHGQPQAAVEALDSAELLGETAPDLYAARLQAICQLIVPTLNPFLVEFLSRADSLHAVYTPEIPEHNFAPVLPLPDRVAFVQRAFADFPVYKAAITRPGAHLQFLDPKWQHAVQLAVTQGYINYAASKTLIELDAKADPETQAFRDQVRQFLEYDPLKGKIPWDHNAGALFADEWSQSLEEETAYYQLVFSKTSNMELLWADSLKSRFIWEKGTIFCPRFIKDPADQKKAYFQFAQNLSQAPETKINGLLLLSAVKDASISEPAYIAFLDELGNEAKDSAKSQKLALTCKAAVELPEDFRRKLADHGVPALRSYLTQSSSFNHDIFHVLWFPTHFPPDDALAIWKEFLDFKVRAVASGSVYANQQDIVFSPVENAFHQAFPQLQQETPNLPPLLIVTRFWQPALSENNGSYFYIEACRSNADTVVVKGVSTQAKDARKIYVFHPTDFKSDPIQAPKGIFSFGFGFSPEAIYITGSKKQKDGVNRPLEDQWQLYRFDRGTQTWEERDIPQEFAQPTVVRNRLFLSIGGGGPHGAISEYDWAAQKLTLWASDRRRPAQNQFDDRTGYQVLSIFPGLNGTIGANIDFASYTISDQPGNWPDLIPDFDAVRAAPIGEKTLIEGSKGPICLLLDPAKPAPEILLAPSDVPLPPALASLGQPRWHLDSNTILEMLDGAKGVHGDALFALLQRRTEPVNCELLWMDSTHGNTPVHIPLQFNLDSSTIAVLGKLTGKPWKSESCVNPDPRDNTFQMTTTDAGICFYSASGLWFVPYEDIAAYLKSVHN